MDPGLGFAVPVVMAAFGVLFLAARKLGAARESLFWGLGFLLSAAAFGFPATDILIPTQLIAFIADTLFALAFFSYACAVVFRFGGPRLFRARIALLAVGIVAPVYGIFIAESLPAETLASDLTCALQLGFALVTARCWPARRIDRGLLVVLWVVVIQNVLLAASVQLTVGDARPEAFFTTDYSELMFGGALLTSLVFAILALSGTVSDLVDGYRRDALVDPLTGLLNRRGLAAIAGRATAKQASGVICCDLDRFKQVNDTWGHEAGDRVLVAFADLAQDVVGSSGVVSRTGGEEFVIYLADMPARHVRATAENLRAAMRRFDWSPTGIAGHQTASFGVTMRAEAEPLEDALRRADRLVYEAKRNGRDRIEDDLPPQRPSLAVVNR